MSKRKRLARKPFPRFTLEDVERRFWAEHDTTEYFDWSQTVEPVFPNLRPTMTAISLRLPVTMLEELKALANAKDVPYGLRRRQPAGEAREGVGLPGRFAPGNNQC
jgi:hypothetical protein